MANKIFQLIDNLPMYKVVSIGLWFLTGYSLSSSFMGKTDFSLLAGGISLFVFLFSGLFFNKVFSSLAKVKEHSESQIITSLILFLLFTPEMALNSLISMVGITFVSTASKYFLVHNATHIFNPAAFGAFIGTILFNYPATWWIGSAFMLPAVILISLVILRKLRKTFLAGFFLLVSFLLLYIYYGNSYKTLTDFTFEMFLAWPLVFFVAVMVTEPFTYPKIKKYEIPYLLVIAVLTTTRYHLFNIGTSPEFALLVANLMVFVLTPGRRFILKFVSSTRLSDDSYEYTFKSNSPVLHKPGQFLELMVPHDNADMRGIRRYFTIASAPGDEFIKFGIKFPDRGSTYKKHLLTRRLAPQLYGELLQGDFTLDSSAQKLIFIAGGIGITPFISMIRSLKDKNSSYDITLFYLVSSEGHLAYKEELDSVTGLNLKVKYLIGERLKSDMFKEALEENNNYRIYISGPSGMVDYYHRFLRDIGVPNSRIKRDFFNGY